MSIRTLDALSKVAGTYSELVRGMSMDWPGSTQIATVCARARRGLQLIVQPMQSVSPAWHRLAT